MENNKESEIIRQRKIRNGRYVYEDYIESIEEIKKIGYVNLILGGLYLISVFFLGDINLSHSMISLLIGFSILFALKIFSFEQNSIVISIMTLYLFIVIMEYFIFGLPSQLIPGLGVFGNGKLLSLITFANSLSPLLYFGLKIVISYLFLMILINENKVSNLPKNIKNSIGLKYKK